MKTYKKTAALELYNQIIAAGVESNVVWGCGDADVHQYMKDLDSEIATYYPQSAVIMTYIWHLLGCLMCCPLKNDVLFTPVMTQEEEDRQIWF